MRPECTSRCGAGKRVTLDRVGMFADGVRGAARGRRDFSPCPSYVDEIILVTRIRYAPPSKIFSTTRAPLPRRRAPWRSGIKKYVARENCTARTLIAINGGANMNFDRLAVYSRARGLGRAA